MYALDAYLLKRNFKIVKKKLKYCIIMRVYRCYRTDKMSMNSLDNNIKNKFKKRNFVRTT